MANIAIFASGNGSNFEALADEFKNDKNNKILLLICNKKNAFVLERTKKFGIKPYLLNYLIDGQKNVENKVVEILNGHNIDVIFLAGFMRVLSSDFINKVQIPIINIHPSLLPKYKGISAIEQAFNSDDTEIGITIHYVNEEIDSGEIIIQKSIPLKKELGFEKIENSIHQLEHKWYPVVAKEICEKINSIRKIG